MATSDMLFSFKGILTVKASIAEVGPRSLFFACPSTTYPGDLPAALVETGRLRLTDDGDTGLNDWLTGQDFFGEAYSSAAARDAKLGPVHTHVTFVATTWHSVESGGACVADVAIGPSLGEEGFEDIAALVIPAKVERLLMFGFGGCESDVSVIIDRVDYTVRRDESGALSITAGSLYRAESDEPKREATMAWLIQAFADRLTAPPTPPTLPRRSRSNAPDLSRAA